MAYNLDVVCIRYGIDRKLPIDYPPAKVYMTGPERRALEQSHIIGHADSSDQLCPIVFDSSHYYDMNIMCDRCYAKTKYTSSPRQQKQNWADHLIALPAIYIIVVDFNRTSL